MENDFFPEYMTIEQAAAYLSVKPAQVRKLLRDFGLSEFTRAQIGKEVKIRRQDLDVIAPSRPASAQRSRRGGAA